MTLRTKTLTAVAALTISAGGFAFAQDNSTTTTVPMTAPDAAQPAPEGGTTFVATPAEEGTTADTTEAEAPAEEEAAPADEAAADEAQPEATAEEATAEEPAAGAAGDQAAEDEAATEEAPAEEAAAEEPAAEDAAVEEPAAEEAASEEPAAEEPATEDAAAEEPAAGDAGSEEATSEEPAAEEAAGAEEGGHDEAAAESGGGHGGGHIEDVAFSFEGPFGKYDQFQLQRGLQVYTEVCSACHGMKFVPIRTLHDEGGPALPEDQVRAYAANLSEITDPETGEDRPRLPTDHFPAVTGDGMGPDLSLMAKARAGFHGPYGTGISQFINGIGGPEYIHAILTSYTGETMEQAGATFYENTAFSTGHIAMPPPLSDDLVTYEDGTPATVDQMSMDVAAFLMWTAEPKMMDRKMVGLAAVLLLIVLSALLYLTNKRIWAPHKGKHLDQ